MSARSCFLQCAKDMCKKIHLPHDKTISLGRNEITSITDVCLSRNQVAVTANYDNYCVTVKTLGTNYSGCNGYALMKGETYVLKHGDHVELRLGFHVFVITFDPPPADCASAMDEDDLEPKPKKMKHFAIFNTANKNKFSSSPKASGNETDEMMVAAPGQWEEVENKELLIYTSANVKSQSKIAAFDLDGTLVRTKSGGAFAKSSEDWTLNFPDIKNNLIDLHAQNYKVIIFTNQAGIGLEKVKKPDFQVKIENIVKCLSVPVQLFAATNVSIFRKPAPGMWNVLCSKKNDNVEIDLGNSFYVGDAAGRKKDWAPKKKSNISVGDRLFALNVGIKFYTPEEYFLKASSAPYTMPTFDPKTVQATSHIPPLGNSQEMILMVGIQGSGKSHYCKTYINPNGYVYVNRDTIGSRCVKTVEEALKQKRSVVVDNTNPDQSARKTYIDLAKKYEVTCRCFVMTTSFDQAKHNNRFREITDKTHAKIAPVLFHSFKKNFQEPTREEGLKEIVKIDFIPKFHDPEHEKLYEMFLMEK